MVNFGLLGTGMVATEAHTAALKRLPEARLWSVCSRSLERATAFAAAHGAMSPSPAYSKLQDFLGDHRLHAVIVATPDGLHAEQAIACMQAGKHVFVEKPMATTVVDAKKMIQVSEFTGMRLAVGYHLRWHEGHRRLAAAVSEGRIGTLCHMRVQWTGQVPNAAHWRTSPDLTRWWALGAAGTHGIDLSRWLMTPSCGEVEIVSSVHSHPKWGGPHDEIATVTLGFQSGASAVIVCSVLFPSVPRVDIYGTLGCFICEGTLGSDGLGTIVAETGDLLHFSRTDPFANQLVNFIDGIQSGAPIECDGYQGLDNVELLIRAIS